MLCSSLSTNLEFMWSVLHFFILSHFYSRFVKRKLKLSLCEVFYLVSQSVNYNSGRNCNIYGDWILFSNLLHCKFYTLFFFVIILAVSWYLLTSINDCKLCCESVFYILLSFFSKQGDIATFELLSQAFHHGVITGMDVCIRKPLIATCGLDRSVRIWNYEAWWVYLSRKKKSEKNAAELVLKQHLS